MKLEGNNKEEIASIGLTEQREDGGDQSGSRAERVVDMLRTNLLNEEKRSLLELCFDYQDAFYLMGIG